MEIKVKYTSIDRCHKYRKFRTLEGARKFAHKWIGEHPVMSQAFQYAISDDGVGKIEVEGIRLSELFPEKEY